VKKNVLFCLDVFLLTILLFICMAASNLLFGAGGGTSASAGTIPALMVYSFLNALILSIWIKNSTLSGIRLAAVCFAVFWGVQYLMTQIETLFFNSAVKMPLSQLSRIVLSGAVYTAAFSLLAVWILGRFRKEAPTKEKTLGTTVRAHEFLPKLAFLTLLYVAVYFLFGYFVAWQFPAIRQFYSGSTQIIGFFQHMAQQSPSLVLFQVFRGCLWALIALLILNSLKSSSRLSFLMPGLLFSVLITTPLLFPNPYMPDPVRFGHSFELFSSMLVYGLLSVPILKKELKIAGRDKTATQI
jgi:hypothetical protein